MPRGACRHFTVCPSSPSLGSACSVSCMNGGSCRGESCLCQRGYTGTVCGQREYPPRTPGLGSQRAGLWVPRAHRPWVTLLEPGFGGTASSSQSYHWVWARWWGFLGEMGFSGPQLPRLLGELRPPSPLPPQLSVTVVATTGAAASDQTTVPVCMASWGLSVREVPSWAWGRGLGGWRGASWQPLRCSQALGSSSWPPFCCL